MAKKRTFGRSKRPTVSLDELGGSADGALAILDEEERRIHMTPARVAASLRYFVARVQLHDAQGLPARLSLTAALAGEGVTYVTRSLAAVIAYDTPASVAIVDLNWRRPTPDQDGVEKPVGLADVVERGVAIDDVIQKTSNPRLCMIAAGEAPVARRPGLVGSKVLADTLDTLEARFDHLLLDLPPVLASSEAMSLSQLADAFVLVVRQGVTAESQVEAALTELQGGEALGVVLNRFDSAIPKRLRRLVGT